jgi:hypothetical protein
MPIGRLLIWAAIACGLTYLVEYFSFALAHSSGGVLAVLVCPGILVVVICGDSPIYWMMAVGVNIAFYEAIWRFLKAWFAQRAK